MKQYISTIDTAVIYIILLVTTGICLGDINYSWTGASTATPGYLIFNDPANWDQGIVPNKYNDPGQDSPWFEQSGAAYPCIIDANHSGVNKVETDYVNLGLHNPGDHTVKMTGGEWVASEIWLGRNGGSVGTTGLLHMEDGLLNIGGGGIRMANGSGVTNGFIVMEGGRINSSGRITVSRHSDGTASIDMTGGEIYANGGLTIGDTGNGFVELKGGTIYASSLSIPSGSMDIAGGVMVLNNNVEADIDTLVLAGKITAFDGLGEIEHDYSGGKTTVWAVTPKAYNPSPLDDSNEVNPNNVELSFSPGETALAHDVYLGADQLAVDNASRVIGQINGDGIINFIEFAVLGQQWYSTFTADTNLCADFDWSGFIDESDLAIISTNWLNIDDGIFQTRLHEGRTSYNAGTLQINTTYYWRVDEFDGTDIIKGHIWQFTTESGQATEPVPADNEEEVDIQTELLEWTPSQYATSQDVYFGTNIDDVNNATVPDISALSGTASQASIPAGSLPLEELTDYYWRVDTQNGAMGYQKGKVWHFTTEVDDSPIGVDVKLRLMNSMVLGEWSTPGDLEDWTGDDVTGLSVTGGYITGTGTAATPSIKKVNFSGPDLDFGYYDYLQIRIKVPASFNDDIIIYFGTSTHSGFDYSGRVFTIPTSFIPKDGQWHTYRLDLGLVVWWRDTLRDIKILPLGNSGSGQTFYIDYVEVGDLPGDVLLVNSSDLNIYAGETLADCSKMESKHATFWWSPQSYVENPSFNPSVMGRRALRMIEESYQVYCKKLGFVEPFESWKIELRDGNRYKTNHITWYGGFWMGGTERFGYIGVPGYGLYDEGWGNPVPHEFAHVVDGHQINFLTGGHWESHANYLRQAWQMHYSERFPINQQSQLDLQIYELSNLRQDHGRLIYRDFRIHQALQDYADDMGIDSNLAAQLWYEGAGEYTVYDKLATLLPGGYTVADVVAFGLRHWPFLDFDDGDKFKNQLWSTSDNKAWHNYITGSLLIPSQDRPGFWRVPFERAPERFGYMYHELDPNDTTVTVEFQGFDLLGSTEDWRWSLAAVDDADNVRFSDLWIPGTHSFPLNPGETKVYLVVVPTPSDTSLNLEYTDNRHPVDKHIDRLHYAYEVRIEGATPARRQLDWNTASGHSHSNGGGWVSNSATVHSTAYVGPNARVLGTAKVYNYARIEDYAIIADNATVRDEAVVSGYAVVKNNAIVRNNAKVRDRAAVTDDSVIENNAVVEDYVHLYGSTNLKDSAIARGVCQPFGGGIVSGTAIVGYDYSFDFALSDGVHFSHVPWGWWYNDYYHQTKAKPRGLVASYRIEEPEGQICWDEFGAQHAIMRGGPLRVTDSQMNSKVLRLDGISQYMVMDRSLCDLSDGSFGLWVKPSSNTNKPLLFMGSSATKYLQLALDGSGHARFTITDGGAPQELVSTSVIPVGFWTHIAVTLDGSQGTLYVNGGAPEAQTSVTLVPDDVLGSNDYTLAEGLYVGRDWAGNLFAGDLEDIRFYNVALTQAEVDNEIRRAGDCLGVFYYDAPQNFDGLTTEVQSGVRNGLERVLEASIYPDTSDDVTYYEAVLDSTDERGSGFEGSGFGLDNGEILVRLENVGFWRTGVYVTLGQWQKISVAFDGSTAQLYVDDVPQGSTSYSATEAAVAGKNYRIGFAMSTQTDPEGNYLKYYFDGQIKDVFIYDKIP